MNDTEVQLAESFDEQAIFCSNCKKKLWNYVILAPLEPITHVVLVNCPFCGGESEKTTIKGQITRGPIGTDQSRNPTRIVDEDLDDQGVWQIKVEKA